jgi:hypothetical protein
MWCKLVASFRLQLLDTLRKSHGNDWKRIYMVRFEVFMAVTMKNAVFWDITLCGLCKNRCFRGLYFLAVYISCYVLLKLFPAF